MSSDARKPSSIGRRQVLTLGAGVAALGAASTVAPQQVEAEVAEPATTDNGRDPVLRDTEHIRRFYERARF